MNDKQELFCYEYLKDLNATQAAIRAGYSLKTAKQQGQRLLTKVDVQTKISTLNKERIERVKVDGDRVLKELESLGTYDPRNVIEWGPNGFRIKDSSELSDEDARIVASLTESPNQWGWRRTIKFHDKLKALELLGKHLGMFTENRQLTGKHGGPIEVVEIRSARRRDSSRDAERIGKGDG